MKPPKDSHKDGLQGGLTGYLLGFVFTMIAGGSAMGAQPGQRKLPGKTKDEISDTFKRTSVGMTYSASDDGPEFKTIEDLLQHVERQKPLEHVSPVQPLPDGKWAYGRYKVEDSVYKTIQKASADYGMPEQVVLAMLARESSLREDAYNKESKACGLTQFVPSTLYNVVYDHAEKIGYPQARKMVIRDTVSTSKGDRWVFRPASEEARTELEKMCLKGDFNLRLSLENWQAIGARMQKKLKYLAAPEASHYPLQPHELYLAHFAGEYPAQRIITNARLGSDEGIDKQFSSAAKSMPTNMKVIFGGNKEAYKAKDFLDKISRELKAGVAVLPNFAEKIRQARHIQKATRKADPIGALILTLPK